MKKYIGLLLLFLSVSICVNANAIPEFIQDNYQVVKDLKEGWLKVDKNNQYVPFIEDDGANDSPVVGALVDLQQYSGSSLLCIIPSGSSVLIEQQIIGHYDKASTIFLGIDSLQQIYNRDQILISVYTPDKNYEQLQLLIVKEGGAGAGTQHTLLERADTSLEDFFIVGLLVLLASYAFQLNQYPKTFRKLYDLRKVFSFKIREETGKIRLVNEANLVFLVHHCFLVAYLMVLLLSTSDVLNLSLVVNPPQSFYEFMLTWLELTVGVFLVIWLKYFTVMMFGALFGMRHLKYIHIFDFMRMSFIFWSILFLVFALIYSGFTVSDSMYTTILVYVFITFAIGRIFILYSRLFTGTSFRNLYLFSYICTSEVIPLLIGIELFVN